MTLEDLRKQITKADEDILRLLIKRLDLSVQTKLLKDEVVDQDRHAEVLSHLKSIKPAHVSEEFIDDVFQKIFKESIRLQIEE